MIKFEFENEQEAAFVLRLLEDACSYWARFIKTEVGAGRDATNTVYTANVVLHKGKMMKDFLWNEYKNQTEQAQGDPNAGVGNSTQVA